MPAPRKMATASMPERSRLATMELQSATLAEPTALAVGRRFAARQWDGAACALRRTTPITDRRLDRPLAAKPSPDHPGTSNTQRLAAVRVHQLVTHPHFRVPMNMVSLLDSTSDSFSAKLWGPRVSAFRGIRYCESEQVTCQALCGAK